MSVLVVQHEEECPPAWFGTWMTEVGAILDVRRPYAGDPLPEDLTEHTGLLVLGGAMNATDEVATPWLPSAKALVRAAVASDVPVLGICLGHQIVADALGGTVAPNPNGSQRALLGHAWTEAAGDDPLFAGRPSHAAHWNNDVVTEPPLGAAVLAHAPGGEVQALRFADRAWGIQSHPRSTTTSSGCGRRRTAWMSLSLWRTSQPPGRNWLRPGGRWRQRSPRCAVDPQRQPSVRW